ncbi:ATP-binding protein [Leptospira wolffii]|uniref:Oxygen sensor histidine kinase NreB n=1 Tax=Leptospira wolffii TaxID=409998 RepID=A0ABV5BM42_9LEPT
MHTFAQELYPIKDRNGRRSDIESETEELLRKISLLNLLQQIATAANEADDTENLLRFALDRICAVAKWDLGRVYLWSDSDNRLEGTPIWFVSEKENFKSLRAELERGEIPKEWNPALRVVEERTAIRLTDIPLNLQKSEWNGICSAYATPIWVKERLVGVLEFFSDAPDSDASLLEALSYIGSQISRVFERKISEENLKNSREELRSLSARLQKAREEERLLVAREIHDELGQLLTVLKIDLTLLRQNRNLIPSTHTLLLEELNEMSQLADTAIQAVQRIATELRPLILDDLGLLEGIEWHAKDFQKRTGILCKVILRTQSLFPDRDTSIALFRIFQETLTNVARHSKAETVSIRIGERDSYYFLSIRDNGIGIRKEELSDSRSLGLIGIRERVIELGGKARIIGQEGKGTLVLVKIPRNSKENVSK